jgi:hypothetical protein
MMKTMAGEVADFSFVTNGWLDRSVRHKGLLDAVHSHWEFKWKPIPQIMIKALPRGLIDVDPDIPAGERSSTAPV